jgi:Uma2 family endonuclease
VVEPDLLIVGAARSAIITERAIEGAPDVLIEILSPSTGARDRGVKSALYARAGVREYWIVDARSCVLEAYCLGDDGYTLRERYDRDGTLRCPDFPTIEIPLAPIFAQ